jgi:CRP-like cAMP-binding protein
LVLPLTQKLEAFVRLSQDDRAALERLGRNQREIAARRDLIREGDSPRFVHLVLDGWACRYKTLPDGRRQIISFFLPGDYCDLNVYVLKEMDHSVGAITKLRIADIPREDMDALTGSHPRITQALWWHELVAAAVQREWTLNLGQRSAYERLSHLLVELFLRLQTVGLTRGDSCDFPLTQNDMADATGLTAVHVNRTLQELRRAQLIVLQGRTLTIPDMAALQSAALFNSNYLHLDREGRALDAND